MKFRVFALLFFAAAVLCFSQEADDGDDWYLGKPINNIVFSGLVNVSPSELEALINSYKGRILTDAVFWEIQGKLYALEYFERIEPGIQRADPDGNEVIIGFNVIERAVVSRINFVGNSGLRSRELTNVINTKVGDVYNHAKLRVDIEAIKNKYIEEGYPNVDVTVDEIKPGEASVVIIFRIVEQDKISISRIEFQGNTKFSTNTLRSQLSLKARTRFRGGVFQESKLIADRETITRYYRERGFVDAIVRDVTHTYSSDDKGTNLLLTFLIEEGSEFKFGGVTFEGNSIFSTAQLSRLISSRAGDVVNMTRLENDLQRISELYYENGYINNSIMRMPDKNYQNNVLSYTIHIVERGRAYIENIIIIGNNKTKTDVILREIPMEPGDVFSRTKIMSALQNLYNLQYFSSIIPDTLQGSTENLMDLVITVEEQPTIDLQFGITFSGSYDPEAFPISGMIKWTDRNIGGTGNEFGAELNTSVVDSGTIAVNYLHRWVLGLPLSLGVDFSANYSQRLTTIYNYQNENIPLGFADEWEYEHYDRLPPREYLMDYDQYYISMGFSTGYRWSTILGTLSVGGGMRFGIVRNVYDAEQFTPFDTALRQGNNEWTPKNSVWLSTSLDRRDISYDPSRGFLLSERIGLYGLIPQEREHYIRSDAKAQYYLTLFNVPITDSWNLKSVLALHVGLSTIFEQPGRRTDPSSTFIEDANKLAIDGMFVGRGWSVEYRRKGLLLLDSWLELRFPVVPGILAWDFFFDMAGVEGEEGYYFGKNSLGKSNFTMENMRFSFGGGFRFTMPQFPIRISLAKRFQIIDGEFKWIQGALFGDSSNPAKGLDLVVSFAMSY